MPEGKQDKYTNMIQASVTQSAANTLTFAEIDLGLTIFQKVGIIINRLEVFPGAGVWAAMPGSGDTFIYAITQSNLIASLSPAENAVVFRYQDYVQSYGTPATVMHYTDPITSDFTNLPGGGLLTTPRPLYAAVDSDSVAATPEIIFRMYFTIIELKADEYFELLESRRFFG